MKQSNQIEFGISAVKSTGSNVVIEGRCHRGPIVLGDTFTVLSEMTVQITAQNCGPATLHPVASVEMKVDSIWAYGHFLKEISQTMTARLQLSGSGIDYLKVGFVLTS